MIVKCNQYHAAYVADNLRAEDRRLLAWVDYDLWTHVFYNAMDAKLSWAVFPHGGNMPVCIVGVDDDDEDPTIGRAFMFPTPDVKKAKWPLCRAVPKMISESRRYWPETRLVDEPWDGPQMRFLIHAGVYNVGNELRL